MSISSCQHLYSQCFNLIMKYTITIHANSMTPIFRQDIVIILQKKIIHPGTKFWSEIPANIKECKTIKSLSNRIKYYLISQY